MLKEHDEIISKIEQGTVIDHIPAGKAASIWSLLRLVKHKEKILIGLNLESRLLPKKDLIKISGRELLPEEVNVIAFIAPEATISIIRNHEVTEKYQVTLPEKLHNCFACPNSRCITNLEKVPTQFHVTERGSHNQICCHYCSHSFTEDDFADDHYS